MIKPKQKTCLGCGKQCYLWISKPHSLCKDCAAKKNYKRKTGLNLNNKPKPRKYIAPIGKKRVDDLAKYRRLRDKHFKEYPVCQFPGCTSTKITLHHMAGRIGAFLTDKRFFKSLCIKHHQFCEENPAEAQRLGLSKKRLDK